MKHYFFLLTILFFVTSCSQAVKETFLIPSGFEGKINVVFNQPNAEAIPIENGRRIYKIPADGILVTSTKFEAGKIDQEYYYVDKNGNTQRISITEKVSKTPSVIKYGVAGVYGNSNEKNPLEFIESIIASEKTVDSIYNQDKESKFSEKIMQKTNRKF